MQICNCVCHYCACIMFVSSLYICSILWVWSGNSHLLLPENLLTLVRSGMPRWRPEIAQFLSSMQEYLYAGTRWNGPPVPSQNPFFNEHKTPCRPLFLSWLCSPWKRVVIWERNCYTDLYLCMTCGKLADFSQTCTWRVLRKVGGFWPNMHMEIFEKSCRILTKLALGEFWERLADFDQTRTWRVLKNVGGFSQTRSWQVWTKSAVASSNENWLNSLEN